VATADIRATYKAVDMSRFPEEARTRITSESQEHLRPPDISEAPLNVRMNVGRHDDELGVGRNEHFCGSSRSETGGKPDTHSRNRGWAANFLAESPMFLLQYPSFHQRIANRKGGGQVDGKFTSREHFCGSSRSENQL
jgi:hypothetical protein